MPADASEPESNQPAQAQTQPLTEATTWPHPSWYSFQPATPNDGLSLSLPPLPAIPTSPETPLFLTPLYSNDASSMQQIMSNPRVAAALLNVPMPYGIAEANSWIALNGDSSSSGLLTWAIRIHYPNDAGLFIGSVSLTNKTGPDGAVMYELGYSLSPEFWGRGIMKNAVFALMIWATEEAGVEEVYVRVESTNGRSKGVIDGIPGFVGEEDQEIDWKGGKKVVRMWRWKATKSTD
ncbi:hypothetical protein VE02_05281 [Pseudogymnoascus sp. 03VT05]|nr:hypothetical protein VE02_05281 [Pseudogymnoascus sp. 03VT05]